MQIPGEFFLVLAIVSSGSMALIMKAFQNEEGNRYGIILGNYLTCILVGFLMLPDKTQVLRTERMTLLCGGIGGILFVAGLVFMQSSIAANGAILTSAFSRLGLLVPLLISIVFYREKPGIFQILGLVLTAAAMRLIGAGGEDDAAAKDSGQAGKPLLLICVLFACGFADSMAKIFQNVGNREQDELYFFYIFLFAAILTGILLLREKYRNGKKVRSKDLLSGIAVGIPNYFASALLLQALRRIPAIIVYPSVSTGTILLVTLISAILFKERPGRRQWIGLGLILAALILLNI